MGTEWVEEGEEGVSHRLLVCLPRHARRSGKGGRTSAQQGGYFRAEPTTSGRSPVDPSNVEDEDGGGEE